MAKKKVSAKITVKKKATQTNENSKPKVIVRKKAELERQAKIAQIENSLVESWRHERQLNVEVREIVAQMNNQQESPKLNKKQIIVNRKTPSTKKNGKKIKVISKNEREKQVEKAVDKIEKIERTAEETAKLAEAHKNLKLAKEAKKIAEKAKALKEPFYQWDDSSKDYYNKNKKIYDSMKELYESFKSRNFQDEIDSVKEYVFSKKEVSTTNSKKTNDDKLIENKNYEKHEAAKLYRWKYKDFYELIKDVEEGRKSLYLDEDGNDQLRFLSEFLSDIIKDATGELKDNPYIYDGEMVESLIKQVEFEYEDEDPYFYSFSIKSVLLKNPLSEEKKSAISDIADDFLTTVNSVYYEILSPHHTDNIVSELKAVNEKLPDIEKIKTQIDAYAMEYALDKLSEIYDFIPEELLKFYIKANAKIESIKRDAAKYESVKTKTEYVINEKSNLVNKKTGRMVFRKRSDNELMLTNLQFLYMHLEEFEKTFRDVLDTEISIDSIKEIENEDGTNEGQSIEDEAVKKRILSRGKNIVNAVKKLLNDKNNQAIRPLIEKTQKEQRAKINALQKQVWSKVRAELGYGIKIKNFTNYPAYVPVVNTDGIIKTGEHIPNPDKTYLTPKVSKSVPFQNYKGDGYKIEESEDYDTPSDYLDLIGSVKNPFLNEDQKKGEENIPERVNYRNHHYTINIFVEKSNNNLQEIARLNLPDITKLNIQFSKNPKTLPNREELPKKITSANNRRLEKNKIPEHLLIKSFYGCLLAATYFQILVSNTPMDEDYVGEEVVESNIINRNIKYRTSDGRLKSADEIADEMLTYRKNRITKKIKHKADKVKLRADWILKFRGKQFKAFASEPAKGGASFNGDYSFTEDLFEKRNDGKAIEKIALILFQQTGFKDKSKKELNFDNSFDKENLQPERVRLLEYGGYKDKNGAPANSIAKWGLKYEHGTMNGFSYQAPKGFVRLTDSVFSNISNGSRWEDYARTILKKLKGLNIDVRRIDDDGNENFKTDIDGTDWIVRKQN